MQEKLQAYATQLGYQQPTAIQKAVYGPMLQGQSVLGIAPTGSGKTVAFTVPVLERIMAEQTTQAIILEPTAELAAQTSQVMSQWAAQLDIKVLSLIGGANIKRQMERLKKHPQIVVGTPGRILNLIEIGRLKTSNVTTVIVDEADNLLSEDSMDQVRSIVDHTPTDVTLGFFSATTNDVLAELSKWFIPEVTTLDVRDIDDTQGEVTHELLMVSNPKKAQMLMRLLHMPKFKALVFFNQVATLKKTAAFLRHNHVAAGELTADQRQVDRQKALTDFRNGKLRLLLTTDVAARGMDIADLPAVINFDLPKDARVYVHRSGRTGRMGASGQVLSFGNDHDLRELNHLITPQGYQPVKVYFAGNQLTTNKPTVERSESQVTTTTNKVTERATKSKTITGGDKPIRTTGKKAVTPSNPVSTKKHNKKKHSKRKGMRHKREQS